MIESLEPRLLLSGTQYIVDSLLDTVADDGVITLREAIEAANTNTATFDVPAGSNTETDTITFDPSLTSSGPATITLNGSQLEITESLDIFGPGQGLLIIDADNLSRALNISGLETDIQLSGVTITGGYTSENGGGILAGNNTLSLTNVTVSGNVAEVYGGGICGNSNLGVNLLLVNSTISDNSSFSGGGIYNRGSFELIGTDVVNNNAVKLGGGIYQTLGTLTLTGSSVSGNSATGEPNVPAAGGGIYNQSADPVVLINTTVSSNTVSSHWSNNDGGGIYNTYSDTILTHSTVVGNAADKRGGGLYCTHIVLNNSIVALNDAPYDADISGSYTSNNSLVSINPGLARNPDDGGDGWADDPDTTTIDESANNDYGDLHLTESSLAINHGDTTLALDADGNPLTMDKDGNPRIINTQVDIGAYEYQATQSTPETESTQVTTQTDVVDATDNLISLREAIFYADLLSDDITFNAALTGGTIILTEGDLLLDKSVAINALSIGGVTIDGNGLDKVMTVKEQANIDLIDLTITGGNSITVGGGICKLGNGTLTLNNTTISGNSTTSLGGGIYNSSGNLILIDSTVSGNTITQSYKYGIGIYNSGTAILSGSTISNNHSAYSSISGGGIYNRGTMSIDRCTISGNVSSNGGGIYNFGELFINDSLITGNSSTQEGGGIANQYGTLVLTDSTISHNSAGYYGGGIYVTRAETTILQSSVINNDSNYRGGGIYSRGYTIEIVDTDVSDNYAKSSYGGIYSSDDSVIISNSTINNNDGIGIYISGSETTSIYNTDVLANHGIAIQLYGIGDASLTNVIVAGNDGTGIHNRNSMTQITNTIISSNVSVDAGGGIYNGNNGYLILTNSVVTDNTSYATGGGIYTFDQQATLNNSIVALNQAPDNPDINESYSNNHSLIGIDPLFLRNPDDGGDDWFDDPTTPLIDESANNDYGDLHLQSSSPAINAGDNTLLPADQYDLDNDGDTIEPLPLDLDSNPRVVSYLVDMGAYELPVFIPFPGDTNLDGKINLVDLITLGENYNQPGDWSKGDFNNDNFVDLADLVTLGENYNIAAPLTLASQSATPSSALLLDNLTTPASPVSFHNLDQLSEDDQTSTITLF